MISKIKNKIESAFKIKFYRNSLPHGSELYADINKHFGLSKIKLVFDIGANIGQSALTYVEYFPNARIFSFEPVGSTFDELVSHTKSNPRITCINKGMGRQKDRVKINVNPDSKVNSIKNTRMEDTTENIEIDTVYDFCRTEKIEKIDFMKIDTEGYEMEVLEGCKTLLENQQIKIIIAECSPLSHSDYFTTFTELSQFLNKYKYELFGIYEQQLDWGGKKKVHFFNAMFVSNELIENK